MLCEISYLDLYLLKEQTYKSFAMVLTGLAAIQYGHIVMQPWLVWCHRIFLTIVLTGFGQEPMMQPRDCCRHLHWKDLDQLLDPIMW